VITPVTAWTRQYDTIDILVIWTIILFVVIQFLHLLKKIRKHGLISPIKNWCFKQIRKLPYVKNKIKNEVQKVLKEMEEDVNKVRTKKTYKLPAAGYNPKTIRERLDLWINRDYEIYKSRKITGALYLDDLHSDYVKLVKDYTKEFSFSNPLHFELFPSIPQMEAEVISMTAGLFHPTNKTCGLVSSGGTESILLAVLAYRQWALETKGIKHPNIVLSETAHVAFLKAAFYFDIKTIKIPVSASGRIDPKRLAKSINSNTIAIIGSFPDFPYGITDNIEELAKIAKKHNIGLHVDCCLGGIVSAFAETCGLKDLGKFDFQLEGVTTLSCDPHKHAQAPKGVSVLLFKNEELRSHAIYSTSSWIGGIYATPTLQGSRSGAPIAGAWIAMLYYGYNGYKDQAEEIMKGTQKFAQNLRKIHEIEVIGEPQLCVVAFKAKGRLNIHEVIDILLKKGWHLSALQKPAAVHLSVTSYNLPLLDDLVKEIKIAVATAIENPSRVKSGTVAMYGSTAQLPETLVDEACKLAFTALLKP